MKKAIAPPKAVIHAIPYVAGVSRRVKAEPTKLSPLSAKMMSASGTFSSGRGVASFPLGRVAGGVAFLSLAVALALGGDRRPDEAQTQVADALTVQSAPAPTLELDHGAKPVTMERSPGAGDTPSVLPEGQDRLEIERLNRLKRSNRQEQH